jgi:hypothetical protein
VPQTQLKQVDTHDTYKQEDNTELSVPFNHSIMTLANEEQADNKKFSLV